MKSKRKPPSHAPKLEKTAKKKKTKKEEIKKNKQPSMDKLMTVSGDGRRINHRKAIQQLAIIDPDRFAKLIKILLHEND